MSEPQWRPLKMARAHEMVIEAIEEQILAGSLRVDDALPPERELAARLGVSRAGVREAVRVLESQGVLRSRTGSGPEAGTFVAALPREALVRFLRLHVALSNFAVDDVTSARIVLERASAELAAGQPDSPARTAMIEALDRMGTPGLGREEFNDADTEFHLAIAEASGSALSAALTAAIRAALRGPILEAALAVEDWQSVVDQLQADHRAIHDAVLAGDGPRAAELTERHIRSAAELLSLASGPAS